jgi:hypothetical protein
MAYELDEKTFNSYRRMSLRAYSLTGKEITEEEAKQLVKLIKKTTKKEEQDAIIINYLK